MTAHWAAVLVALGAVFAVLIVAAVPGELRREDPPLRPDRPLGWCLAAARERRDRVDPGARWEPVARTTLPAWATEPTLRRTWVVHVPIPPADRLPLAACRWEHPSPATKELEVERTLT